MRKRGKRRTAWLQREDGRFWGEGDIGEGGPVRGQGGRRLGRAGGEKTGPLVGDVPEYET